jgi:hypothetical protein
MNNKSTLGLYLLRRYGQYIVVLIPVFGTTFAKFGQIFCQTPTHAGSFKQRTSNRVDCPASKNWRGEPLTPPYVRVSYTAAR